MNMFQMTVKAQAGLELSGLSTAVKMAIATLDFSRLNAAQIVEAAEFYNPELVQMLSQGALAEVAGGKKKDLPVLKETLFRMELERRDRFTPEDLLEEVELAKMMPGYVPAQDAFDVFMSRWFGRDWLAQILRKKAQKSGMVKEYTGGTVTKTTKSGKTKEVAEFRTYSVSIGQMPCVSSKPLVVGKCPENELGQADHLPTIFSRTKASCDCGRNVTDTYAAPVIAWVPGTNALSTQAAEDSSSQSKSAGTGDMASGAAAGKSWEFFVTGIAEIPVIRKCGASFPEVVAWKTQTWEKVMMYLFPHVDAATKNLWRQSLFLPMDEIDNDDFRIVMEDCFRDNPLAELLIKASANLTPMLSKKEAYQLSLNAFAGNGAPRTNAGNAKKVWIKEWDAPKYGKSCLDLSMLKGLDARMEELLDEYLDMQELMEEDGVDRNVELLALLDEYKAIEAERLETFKGFRAKMRAQNVAKYRNGELSRVDEKGRFSTQVRGKGRDAKRRTGDKSTRVNGVRIDVLTLPLLQLRIDLELNAAGLVGTDESISEHYAGMGYEVEELDAFKEGKRAATLAAAGFVAVNKGTKLRFNQAVDPETFKSTLELVGMDWKMFISAGIEAGRFVPGQNDRDDMERCITEYMLRISAGSTQAALLKIMARDQSMYDEGELMVIKTIPKKYFPEDLRKITTIAIQTVDGEELRRMEEAAELLEELGEEVTPELLLKAYRQPKRFEARLQAKRGTMEDKFRALEELWNRK